MDGHTEVPTLPPGVPGHSRGELSVDVVGLQWNKLPRHQPRSPVLLIRWWGDSSSGTYLPATPGESLAFPICCGPKYLTRYLRDVATLPIRVVEFTNSQTIGQVLVDVRHLDMANPIRGSFPITSLTQQHVGSLELSVDVRYQQGGPGMLTSFEVAEHQATSTGTHATTQPSATKTSVRQSGGAQPSTIAVPRQQAAAQRTPQSQLPPRPALAAAAASAAGGHGAALLDDPSRQGAATETADEPGDRGLLEGQSEWITRDSGQFDMAAASHVAQAGEAGPTGPPGQLGVPGPVRTGVARGGGGVALVGAAGGGGGLVDFEGTLEGLDLTEILHSRMARDFNAFYDLYQQWKGSATTEKSVRGLIHALQKNRVFQYHISPQQALYLELSLDPTGTLTLEIDEIIGAIRHAMEAGLRVRSAQLDPVLPLLAPLAQHMQQRGPAIRSLRQQQHLTGEDGEGDIDVRTLAAWLQSECPSASPDLIRYIAVILLHISDASKLGQVTMQDVKRFYHFVLGYDRAAGYDLIALSNAPRAADAADAAAAASQRHEALMKLKRRTTRSVRPTLAHNIADTQHTEPAQLMTPTHLTHAVHATRTQHHADKDTGSNTAQNALTGVVGEGAGLGGSNAAGGSPDAVPAALPQPPVAGLLMRTPVFVDIAPPQVPVVTHNPAVGAVATEHAGPAEMAGAMGAVGAGRAAVQQGANGSGGNGEDGGLVDMVAMAMSLREELDRAMQDDANTRGSAGTTPQRPTHTKGRHTKGRHAHQATEMLSVLGGQTAPDVLLDLLQESPAATTTRPFHSPPTTRPHPAHHTHTLGASLDNTASPGFATRMASPRLMALEALRRHARQGTGATAARPDASLRSTYDSVEGVGGRGRGATLRQRTQDFHRSVDSVSDSDTSEDGGAAGFVEQQLLKQLFFTALDKGPSGGAAKQDTHAQEPTRGDTTSHKDQTPPPATPPTQPSRPATPPPDTPHIHISLQDLQLTTAEQAPQDALSAPPAQVVFEVWSTHTMGDHTDGERDTGKHGLTDLEAAIRAPHARLVGVAHAPVALLDRPSRSGTPLAPKQTGAGSRHTIGTAAGTGEGQGAEEHTLSGPLSVGVGVSGVFPVVDLLGDGCDVGSVSVRVGMRNGRPLLRHTWRVTLCAAGGLPSADILAGAGLPVPVCRYAKYLYPGESCALITEDVPSTSDSPIFAATAMHSLVLPGTARPDIQLLLGQQSAGASPANRDLIFEVWDRWAAGPDTCVGGAHLPFSTLLDLPSDTPTALQLPLTLNPQSCETLVIQPPNQPTPHHIPHAEQQTQTHGDVTPTHTRQQQRGSQVGTTTVSATVTGSEGADGGYPAMEVRLQYERVVVGAVPLSGSDTLEAPGVHAGEGEGVYGAGHEAYEGATGARGRTVGEEGVGGASGPVPATLSVEILNACGLQAAVQEAQVWLGAGAAALGRALQLGPHAYVTLQLFPADSHLAAGIPVLRTPFQAQAFCPRYDWHQEVSLSLDPRTLHALSSQQLCVEVWHHPSRSLAALAHTTQQQQGQASQGQHGKGLQQGQGGVAGVGDSKGGVGGVSAALSTRDVLLGSGTCAMDKLLLRPDGFHGWVLLRSARGALVGAVRLALRFTSIGNVAIDTCLAAPSPMEQAAFALQGLPAPEPPLPSVEKDLFHGQWSRCTLYLEHVTIQPAPTSLPGAAQRWVGGSKNATYHLTFTLPGTDVEVSTASKPASLQGSSSATVTGQVALSIHVALQHCSIHWVRADDHLAGALCRSPLKLALWRVLEKPGAASPAATARGWGPAQSSSQPQKLGACEIDLSQLATRTTAAHDRDRPSTARWFSSTVCLVDPQARCFTRIQARIKVLLELSPPTNGPTTRHPDTWQPSHEYSAPSRPVSPPPESPNTSPAHSAGVEGHNSAQRSPEEMMHRDAFSIASGGSGQRRSVAVHPVLGMSSVPAHEPVHPALQQVEQTSQRSSAEPPTAHRQAPPSHEARPQTPEAQGVLSPGSAGWDSPLARTASNPEERLRYQLQELDVMGELWRRRLTMELSEGRDHAHEAAPSAARATAAQMPSNLEAQDGASPSVTAGQGGASAPVQSPLREALVTLQDRLNDLCRDETPPLSQPDVSSTHAANSTHVPSTVPFTATQSVHLLPNTSAAQGPDHAQHSPPATGSDGPGGSVYSASTLAAPSSQHTHTGSGTTHAEVGSRSLWVSTVAVRTEGTAERAQQLARAVETCSDDGGGDCIMGGYSASECGTDELMAQMTVTHEVQQAEYTYGGDSDEEDVWGAGRRQAARQAGPLQPVSDPPSPLAAPALAAAAAAVARSQGGAAAPVRGHGQQAAASAVDDWMFTFIKR